MRVLQVADIPGWAIDKLTQSIIKYSPDGIRQDIIYMPPRDIEQRIEEFDDKIKEFDPHIIHFQYWNSAKKILELRPDLYKRKLILSHHNEKNICEDFSKINAIIYPTITAHERGAKFYKELFKTDDDMEAEVENNLKIYRVPYGIDLDKFYWREDFTLRNKLTIGYVGRIVRWKRLKSIAIACKEFGLNLSVMGWAVDQEYLGEIKDAIGDYYNQIDWQLNLSEEAVRGFYDEIDIFINNSQDGKETGTLPYLEAMAVGLPILTTRAGLAREWAKDGENCLLLDFNNPKADSDAWERANIEDIKVKLQSLISDKELMNKIRNGAWGTIKNYPEERMAREMVKIYYKTLYPNKELVSVIVPYTDDRLNEIEKIEKAINMQSYKPIELMTINDDEEGYNLAEVRNTAAIDSLGDILFFNDSRLLPDQDAIQNAVDELNNFNINEKVWLFGNKDMGKINFVENFSWIRRDIFFTFGGFNQQIDRYGGMSQETRERFQRQGGKFQYCENVKAAQIKKAAKKDLEKRRDIVAMKFKLWKMGL